MFDYTTIRIRSIDKLNNYVVGQSSVEDIKEKVQYKKCYWERSKRLLKSTLLTDDVTSRLLKELSALDVGSFTNGVGRCGHLAEGC